VGVSTALTLMFNIATSLWFFHSIDQLYPWFTR
jgi:hypothetical protein